jgi:hypothetical protein
VKRLLRKLRPLWLGLLLGLVFYVGHIALGMLP